MLPGLPGLSMPQPATSAIPARPRRPSAPRRGLLAMQPRPCPGRCPERPRDRGAVRRSPGRHVTVFDLGLTTSGRVAAAERDGGAAATASAARRSRRWLIHAAPDGFLIRSSRAMPCWRHVVTTSRVSDDNTVMMNELTASRRPAGDTLSWRQWLVDGSAWRFADPRRRVRAADDAGSGRPPGRRANRASCWNPSRGVRHRRRPGLDDSTLRSAQLGTGRPRFHTARLKRARPSTSSCPAITIRCNRPGWPRTSRRRVLGLGVVGRAHARPALGPR